MPRKLGGPCGESRRGDGQAPQPASSSTCIPATTPVRLAEMRQAHSAATWQEESSPVVRNEDGEANMEELKAKLTQDLHVQYRQRISDKE